MSNGESVNLKGKRIAAIETLIAKEYISYVLAAPTCPSFF